MARIAFVTSARLLVTPATFGMLPPEGVPRWFAELENAIAAVAAMVGEEVDRARQAES